MSHESIEALQQLIHVCVSAINLLGLKLNYKKSVCMRVGSRHLVDCDNIKTLNCLSSVNELIDQPKVRFLSKCRSNMQDNLLCKVCQSQ